MVYGMYADCSALGEEAASCGEVGYLKGKKVEFQARREGGGEAATTVSEAAGMERTCRI